MYRQVSLVSIVLLSGLVAASCKKGAEKKAPAESKTEDKASEVAAVPVVLDVGKIDAMLTSLADATVAAATKARALPELKGELGIACGADAALALALGHNGVETSALKTNGGFAFEDVCVGWRPLMPVTEMYWMISGGERDEKGALATRRCIRVSVAEGGFGKKEILDGPCLSIHEAGRMEPLVEGVGAEGVKADEAKVDEAKVHEGKPKADDPKAE